MKIAVCISTRNRENVLEKCYNEWWNQTIALYEAKEINSSRMSKIFQIFIVDDASELYTMYDYRFPERVGIPRVKNKCIELAYDWGADYFFLSDDDCYPIAPFADAYINSGIHHLSYSFTEPYDTTSARSRRVVKYNGKEFYSYSKPNGCMKFFTRHAIDTIGGYDTRFGLGMYEDVEITRRACNAGLTPFPNMDIIGSDKIFHSMDRFNEVERTFSVRERFDLTNKGTALWNKTAGSKEYIDFRNCIEHLK